MLEVFKQLLVLYVFLIIGWGFGKKKKTLANQSELLSFLLVNLFLPSKVFLSFSKNFTVSYFTERYVTVIFSLSMLLIIVALAIPISKLFSKDHHDQNVYRYSMTLSNYAYLCYVLIEDVFGPTGLTNLILFCIPFAIYTYSFGYSMLTGKEKSLKKLLNPMMIAIFLGMIVGLSGIKIPAVATKIFDLSSSCVGPLSMILTGLTISSFPLKELVTDKKTYAFATVRLVLIPLVVFGVFNLLEIFITVDLSIRISALFVACMPCGLNPIVFPKLTGQDCTLGARLAFITHLFSAITLPIWLSIFI